MRITSRLLASSAIALLASTSLSLAIPTRPQLSVATDGGIARLIDRVQVSVPEAEAALAAAQAKLAEATANGGDVEAALAAVAQAQAELGAAQDAAARMEAAPAPEAAPEPAPAAEPAPEPKPEAPVVEEPAPEPAPATEPAPEPKPAAPAAEEPAPEAPAVEAPAAEAPAAEAPAPEAPAAEAPAPEAPAVEAPAEEAPAPEAPTAEAPAAEPAPEAPVAEAPAEKPAPTPEAKPAAEAPTPEAKPAAEAPTPEAKPAAEAPAADAVATPDAAPAEKPAAEAAPADGQTEATIAVTPEATLPVENGAPVLDSAKEESAAPATEEEQQSRARIAAEPAAPPPTSDAEAQAAVAADAEQVKAPDPLAEAASGERMRERPRYEGDRTREGDVVKREDTRIIFRFDNKIVIRNDSDERFYDQKDEVYYEDLPRGRTRQIIVRPNGVQVVTITNRYGDVIQRSRIMPDGREVLLSYNPRYESDERHEFRDPGRDLPPLRLTIPIDDYILDATDADESDYVRFLREPPVERVERLYSIDEVKRSSRIRDKVRRIDMDTLTFDFGKATIAEDQIESLSNVAAAMTEILDKNPAETFLLEGHTDAVGTDEANLLLSDKRAGAVAEALSGVFGIPPENLATQGYGEQYLKIRTQKPERLNRRVAIRRITPLVTPIASN